MISDRVPTLASIRTMERMRPIRLRRCGNRGIQRGRTTGFSLAVSWRSLSSAACSPARLLSQAAGSHHGCWAWFHSLHSTFRADRLLSDRCHAIRESRLGLRMVAPDERFEDQNGRKRPSKDPSRTSCRGRSPSARPSINSCQAARAVRRCPSHSRGHRRSCRCAWCRTCLRLWH